MAHPAGRMRARLSLLQILGLFMVVLFAAIAVSCGEDEEKPGPAPSSEMVTLRFINRQGKEFMMSAELARTREEKFKGLMGRTSLAENTGMLFFFDEGRSGFWMKDTLIPLSVAFISQDGEIVNIQDMEPKTLDIHNTDKPYYYGLEVNQGWFASRALDVGDQVIFPWKDIEPPVNVD